MKQLKQVVVVGSLLVFAVGYPAGYVVARSSHQIIHTRAHTYDAHGHQVVSQHGVTAGDGKWSPIPPIAAFVFTPLRWVELVGWYLLEPEGKPFGLP